MRRSSISFSLQISIFLKPLGRRCLVFLSCLLPIFGIFWVPLILLLVKQSIPLTFLWESGYTKQKQINKKPIFHDTYVDSLPLMGLESVGGMGDLLYDLSLTQRLDCHYYIFKNKYKNTHFGL